MEGDSQVLINILNQKSEVPWRFSTLITDIKYLSHLCSVITFHHIYHEGNFLADKFANLGHKYSQPCIWFDNFPKDMYPYIYFDACMFMIPRGSSL